MRYGDKIPVGLGFATILPDLDFETYSEAGYQWDDAAQKWRSLPGMSDQNRGLGAVGLYAYVEHPSFEVLSLAYNLKNGDGPRYWEPPVDLRPFQWDGLGPPSDMVNFGADPRHPWPLLDHIASGELLEAWNEEFEAEVLRWCFRKWGWPLLLPAQGRCAMAKSRVSSYPGKLAFAGVALALTTMKDPAGDSLVRKLTVPKNPTKKNPARRWTKDAAPADFAAFAAYNVTDILSEAEASSKVADLSPRELDAWQVTQAINRRGMLTDVVARDNCISIVEQATQKYTAELKAITGGAVESHSEVAATLEWMKTYGVYIGGLDEDIVAEELRRGHTAPVHRVLEIRQMLSFGSVKKLYAMRSQTCSDGRLRGQYAFHAQITGHPSGQGVQPANLYKPSEDWALKPEGIEKALGVIASGSLEYVEGVYGDALGCIANCLRSVICIAPPGYRLISSDYSAIQAVVTAALAGERWRLEVFRTHGKIYEMCAASITGKPFQFYLDYKKQTGTHHPDRQPYGKIPELSAGFGSWINGWKKFGADEFMTDPEIKDAILKWRAASPWIVELWGGQTRNKFNHAPDGSYALEYEQLYGLEGAAIAAVKYPGQCFEYRNIKYQMHGDTLYCKPPGNGDPLQYHEPRLEVSRREYASPWELELSYMGYNSNQAKGKGGWVRMKLYGGVLTQNVVAKVSREYQTDTLSRLEHSGLYLPVMQTYDEAVTEVPIGRGSVAGYLELVQTRRDGCYDDDGNPWPIKVPGAEETFRYGRWE